MNIFTTLLINNILGGMFLSIKSENKDYNTDNYSFLTIKHKLEGL